MEHASGITSSITPLALIERAATKKTSAKRLTAPLYHFAQQTEVTIGVSKTCTLGLFFNTNASNADTSMNFDVRSDCTIEPDVLVRFEQLTRELAALLNPEALESLRTVLVVERKEIGPRVNALIQGAGAAGSYSPSAFGPSGVAVPIESEGRLDCTILIARTVAESLSVPVVMRSADAVSTILEELLHVCVYGLAKERRGYVHHTQADVLACDVDLLSVASQMCDEYVVIRQKVLILGTVPLVQAAEGSEPVVVGLQYGGSLSKEVSYGIEALQSSINEGRTGIRPAQDSWAGVTSVLYRNVFEPLSRYSAYVDDVPSSSSADDELKEFERYQTTLRHDWLLIHEALRRLVTSGLADTELVLDTIQTTLRKMLNELGVSYRQVETGCWVEFGSPRPTD